MKNKRFKSVALDNGQTLHIHDMSRKIGTDACCVVMKAAIDIDIRRELRISENLPETKRMDIKTVLGDKVQYKYERDRIK